MNKASSSQIIKKRRKELGKSQREIAEAANISQQYVTLIERGIVPPENVKRQIAKAIGLDVWDIWPEVRGEIDLFEWLCSRWPDLKIGDRERSFYKEVLSRLDEDDLADLFWSGTDTKDVPSFIKKFAKKYHV